MPRTTARVPAPAQLLGFGLLVLDLLVLGSAGCAGTAAGTPSATPSATRTVADFAAAEVGQPPRGFTTALTGGGGAADWRVRQDAGAYAPRRIPVQESRDDTSYRFPLCVYDGATAQDVAVTVAFSSISGQVDQAAGIVLRYSPETYSNARANALEGNVTNFKTVAGKRTLVKDSPVAHAAGEWHDLGFAALGGRLAMRFDGTVVLEADDEAITAPGRVGPWTRADSISAFAQLTIDSP